MTRAIPAAAISFEQHWDRTDRFDPPELLDSLRRERPIARMTYPDGHLGWLVTSYDLVRKVLSDPRFSHKLDIAHFPVTRNGEPIPPLPIMPGMFIHMDPPEHTRYRRLLAGEFTFRRMSQVVPRVEAFTDQQVAALLEHGSPADLVAVFIQPLVLRIMSELLGMSRVEAEKLAEYAAVSHEPEVDVEWATGVIQQTMTTARQFVSRKLADPGDDLMSRLITLGELTDEELANILLLLFVAGYVTTEGALAVSIFALLAHPGQLATLRAESKLDSSVEELLRYTSVNQYEIFRVATEDIKLGDEVIRNGQTVTLSLPAANRDPSRFPCPRDLDITRDASGHLSFGHGVHQCLGQNLARIALTSALTALLEALPDLRLAIPAEQVPLRTRTSVFSLRNLPVSW